MKNVDERISPGTGIAELLQHVQTFREFPQLARYSLCILRENTSSDKSNRLENIEEILRLNGCEILLQFLLEGHFSSDCDELGGVNSECEAEEDGVKDVSVEILKCLTQISFHLEAALILLRFIGDLMDFVLFLISAAGRPSEDENVEDSNENKSRKSVLPCASAALDLIEAILRHHPQKCSCVQDLAPPFDERVTALLEVSFGEDMEEIASRCLDILRYIATDKVIRKQMRRMNIAKSLIGFLKHVADDFLSEEEDDVQQMSQEVQCSILTVSKSLLKQRKMKYAGTLLCQTMDLLLMLSESAAFKNIVRDFGGVDILLSVVQNMMIHEKNFRVHCKFLAVLVDEDFGHLVNKLNEEVRQNKHPSIHVIEQTLSLMLAIGMHDSSVFSGMSLMDAEMLAYFITAPYLSSGILILLSHIVARIVQDHSLVEKLFSSKVIAALVNSLLSKEATHLSIIYTNEALYIIILLKQSMCNFLEMGCFSTFLSVILSNIQDFVCVSSCLKLMSLIARKVVGVYEAYITTIIEVMSIHGEQDVLQLQCTEIIFDLCSLDDDGKSYAILSVRAGVVDQILSNATAMRNVRALLNISIQVLKLVLSYSKAVSQFGNGGGIGVIALPLIYHSNDLFVRSIAAGMIRRLCDDELVQSAVDSVKQMMFEDNSDDIIISSVATLGVIAMEPCCATRLVKYDGIRVIIDIIHQNLRLPFSECCMEVVNLSWLSLCEIFSNCGNVSDAENVLNIRDTNVVILSAFSQFRESEICVLCALRIAAWISRRFGKFMWDETDLLEDVNSIIKRYRRNKEVAFASFEFILCLAEHGFSRENCLKETTECIATFVHENILDDNMLLATETCLRIVEDILSDATVSSVLIEQGFPNTISRLLLASSSDQRIILGCQNIINRLFSNLYQFANMGQMNAEFEQSTVSEICNLMEVIEMLLLTRSLSNEDICECVSFAVKVVRLHPKFGTDALVKSLRIFAHSGLMHCGVLDILHEEDFAAIIGSLRENTSSFQVFEAVSAFAAIDCIGLKLIQASAIETLWSIIEGMESCKMSFLNAIRLLNTLVCRAESLKISMRQFEKLFTKYVVPHDGVEKLTGCLTFALTLSEFHPKMLRHPFLSELILSILEQFDGNWRSNSQLVVLLANLIAKVNFEGDSKRLCCEAFIEVFRTFDFHRNVFCVEALAALIRTVSEGNEVVPHLYSSNIQKLLQESMQIFLYDETTTAAINDALSTMEQSDEGNFESLVCTLDLIDEKCSHGVVKVEQSIAYILTKCVASLSGNMLLDISSVRISQFEKGLLKAREYLMYIPDKTEQQKCLLLYLLIQCRKHELSKKSQMSAVDLFDACFKLIESDNLFIAASACNCLCSIISLVGCDQIIFGWGSRIMEHLRLLSCALSLGRYSGLQFLPLRAMHRIVEDIITSNIDLSGYSGGDQFLLSVLLFSERCASSLLVQHSINISDDLNILEKVFDSIKKDGYERTRIAMIIMSSILKMRMAKDLSFIIELFGEILSPRAMWDIELCGGLQILLDLIDEIDNDTMQDTYQVFKLLQDVIKLKPDFAEIMSENGTKERVSKIDLSERRSILARKALIKSIEMATKDKPEINPNNNSFMKAFGGVNRIKKNNIEGRTPRKSEESLYSILSRRNTRSSFIDIEINLQDFYKSRQKKCNGQKYWWLFGLLLLISAATMTFAVHYANTNNNEIQGTPAKNQTSNKPNEQQYPSSLPNFSPSSLPTMLPALLPSKFPSERPSKRPSMVTSISQSFIPTETKSDIPSLLISDNPSKFPSYLPSNNPTDVPQTLLPSLMPTSMPSNNPTALPSVLPSTFPSEYPSERPSGLPSIDPSTPPSGFPTSAPSKNPSVLPTMIPSVRPSDVPSAIPSSIPSFAPSYVPSQDPSFAPSVRPSSLPSFDPSSIPTLVPSAMPTKTRETKIRERLVAAGVSAVSLETIGSAQRLAFTYIVDLDGTQLAPDAPLLVQRFSMVSLYYSTGGGSWLQSSKWLTHEHECTWYGVTVCDEDGYIVKIYLGKSVFEYDD